MLARTVFFLLFVSILFVLPGYSQEEGLTVDAGGNVGIGTETPNERLEVASQATANETLSLVRLYSTSLPSVGKGPAIDYFFGGATFGRIETTYQGNAYSDMVFSLYTNRLGTPGLKEVMRISDLGNVGLGTNSPNSKLTIYQSGLGSNELRTGLRLRNDATGGGWANLGQNRILFQNKLSGSNWRNAEIRHSMYGLHFAVNETTADIADGTELSPAGLTINNSGLVGVRASTPGSYLQVGAGNESAGDSNNGIHIDMANTAYLRIDGARGGPEETSSLQFYNQGYEKAKIFIEGNDTSMFLNTIGNTDQMVLASNGRVGIGTSSPGYPLHVAGSIYSSGSYVGSDMDLKTDITAIDGKDICAGILELPISSWRFKDDAKRTVRIGPMAQDVKQYLKFASNGKAISLGDMNGIALAAIKELIKENKSLKKKNKDLETRLEKIEASLKKLVDQNN